MREINELIWHCTATPEGREVSVAEIDKWHKARGWKGIGYHKLVHLDGRVSVGRPESEQGAHVAGRNRHTIGYAYVGGVGKDGRTPKDTRTAAQRTAMRALTADAVTRHHLSRITGHRQYAAKACPSFDVRIEYADLLQSRQRPSPESCPQPSPAAPPTFVRPPPRGRRALYGALIVAALGAAFLLLT